MSEATRESPSPPTLPAASKFRLARSLLRLLRLEAASGIVLLAATALALVAANSGMAGAWERLWDANIRVGVRSFALDEPVRLWVNDALMAIFFFVVGLEIKRELVAGELAEARKVALPVLAAAGGAALPALLFVALRAGTPDARGWAVPMATDIAFVVGILALLGPRVPRGLKVLVLSIAIVDDIFAVIVIAAFFSESIHVAWLAGALAGFALVFALKLAGVRRIAVYVAVGAVTWLCTLESGIHPTVAGALLGLMTPAVPVTAGDPVSPLDRLERALHPWVSFGIMPLFALVNAGVPIGTGAAASALPISIAVALVVGKPAGIALASWLAVRARWATMPNGVSWRALIAAGCLCGIGFTMAIFVASLAFADDALVAAKLGVLLGSLASALLGAILLRAFLPRRRGAAPPAAGSR